MKCKYKVALFIVAIYTIVSGETKNMLSCEHTGLLSLIRTPLRMLENAMHEAMDLPRRQERVSVSTCFGKCTTLQ